MSQSGEAVKIIYYSHWPRSRLIFMQTTIDINGSHYYSIVKKDNQNNTKLFIFIVTVFATNKQLV